jgi:hypothetical protein
MKREAYFVASARLTKLLQEQERLLEIVRRKKIKLGRVDGDVSANSSPLIGA